MRRSRLSPRYTAITHKLDTIYTLIIFDELVDVTMIHPLRYDREPVPFQIRTDKR